MFNSCINLGPKGDETDAKMVSELMNGTLTREHVSELAKEKARKDFRETFSPIVY